MLTPLKGLLSFVLFIGTTYFVYVISLPIFLESLDPEGSFPSDSRRKPRLKRTYRGRHLICHHFFGGIGDQLFQYASLLALADHQLRFLITTNGDSMLDDVLIDFKARPAASHCKNVKTVREKFCCRDDDRFLNLDGETNYNFEGSLRSWVYFRDKDNMIKTRTQFQRPIVQKAMELITSVLKNGNLPLRETKLIGVHVRRGDRAEEQHIRDGYRVAPKDYFLKAMDYFRQRLNNTVFLVVSQDSEWCKNNLVGQTDVYYVPPHPQEIDLSIFTLVHHSIISVGSFSWWAGYFTKGKVIYYKYPIQSDSKMMTEYGGTLANTFKPEWVPMA